MPRRRPAVNSGARFTRESKSVRRRHLIEAATRCLARGGIEEFTVDRICREAGVSRGLINHYFTGKDELLIAVYQAALYETMTRHVAQMNAMSADSPALLRLTTVVEGCFLPSLFHRSDFLVWLAFWAEVSRNPRLRDIHRELYGSFRINLAEQIAHVAQSRGLAVDAKGLARDFVALMDGLWIEWCLDEGVMGADDIREACWDLLESKLGPLR
jgi:TetR/AcrR family transcriptional regulator, transcriptional repressor of bet genes